ncbi:hypothetical protein [Streptomyces sp. NPDC007355]|uniref:hypothetical protein n=1 Tax=Streptomyces sp. NPDC007355 TaxID=3364778 RepID=UPI0036AE42F5
MSNHQTDLTAFMGPIGRGKAALPHDADVDRLPAVLKRALHTIECRELGPKAAVQKFGPLADTAGGRVTVLVAQEQIRARHPSNDELHHLARTVRERGPAVDVFMVLPKPIVPFMDEMAYVVSRAAEPASGLALAEPTPWDFELSRSPRPLWWFPGGDREAPDER